MKTLKIGLFDDHPLLLKGMTNYLLEKVDNAKIEFAISDKNLVHQKIKASKINVFIMEIVAGDVSGFKLIQTIRLSHPALKLIVYSALKSKMLIQYLKDLGVYAFINKKQHPLDLVYAIEKIKNDELFFIELNTSIDPLLNNNMNVVLSDREMQVLKCISQEYTSTEIADRLHLAVSTVENHRKNIFRKLEIKNVAGMIMTANRMGYLS
jgi:DNA-binding NarL/FixJ family response regulator